MNAAGASAWGRLRSWLGHETPGDAYWRLRQTPVAADDTLRLEPFFAGGRLDSAKADAAFRNIAHRIRALRILFAPAVPSGVALKASRLRLMEYLTHQVRQLREDGFDADIADIDAGARVEVSARRLADIIRVHHRPTFVITHSKGGLDFLHMLVEHPELQRYIDGWIAFQAPFLGSPVADVASGRKRARKIGGAALRFLGADFAAIGDLRTDRRARYMEDHAARIASIASDVRIMCVGTVAGTSAFKASLPADWPTGRAMEKFDLRNDGLVPVNSTVLPGAHYVMLDGLGHGQVAASHVLSGRKFEHVDLLKALFAVMLGDGAAATRVVAA